MRVIFQKKGKKKFKKGKKGGKFYKIWKYFVKGQVIACDYRTQ